MSAREVERTRWMIVTPNLSRGAFSKIAAELSAELARREIPITVLYMERHGPPIPLDNRVNVEAIHGRARSSAFQIASHLRRENPGVLLSISFLVNVPCLIASILARYKGTVLVSEHTLPTRRGVVDYPRGFSRGALRVVYNSVYWRADAIACVTQSVKETVANLVVSDSLRRRLGVIPNPVALGTQTPEAEREPSLEPQEGPLFLAIGRLVALKRIDLVITAFSLFVERNATGQLFIAGEGPEEERLQDLAKRLGLEDRVHFVGYLDDVERYLSAATALLHLAHSEAFGMVVVEALSQGTPVVLAEDSQGARELIGGAGVVVEADPRAVSEAMNTLCSDERIRQTLRERAISTTRRFRPDSVVDAWTGLAEEVRLRQ